MAILPKFLCGRDCRRQYLRPCHPLSAAGPPLYNVNDTPVIPLHVVFSACRQSFSQNPILRAAHCTMAAAAAWCAASSALSAAPSPAHVTHIQQQRGDPIGVSGSDQSGPQKSGPHYQISTAQPTLLNQHCRRRPAQVGSSGSRLLGVRRYISTGASPTGFTQGYSSVCSAEKSVPHFH